MSNMKIEKLNNELPATVDPNTIYLIKKNERIDCHISDNTGTNTYLLNQRINPPAIVRNDSGVSVSNTNIHVDETINLKISNFNSFITYTVSAVTGSVVYNNTDEIIYTAPSVEGPAGIIINGKQFNFNIVPVEGIYLNDFCSGVNKMSNYADGNGGTIPEVKEINSLDCNFDPNETVTGVLVYDTFTDTTGTLIENHIGEIGASWVTNGQTSYDGPSDAIRILNNELIISEAQVINQRSYSIIPSGGKITNLNNFTIELGIKFRQNNGNENYASNTIISAFDGDFDRALINIQFLDSMPGYSITGNALRIDYGLSVYGTTHRTALIGSRYTNGTNDILYDTEVVIKITYDNNSSSLYVNNELIITSPGDSPITLPMLYPNRIKIKNSIWADINDTRSNKITYFKLSTTDSIVRQKDRTAIIDKFLGPDGGGVIPGNLLTHTADSGHLWRKGKGTGGIELRGNGVCTGTHRYGDINAEFNSVYLFQEMDSTDYWVELDLFVSPDVGGSIVSIILKSNGQPDRINGYDGDDFISVDFLPDVEKTYTTSYNINYNLSHSNKTGNSNLFEDPSFSGIRLLQPNYSGANPGPYIGYHTLRVEANRINLNVYIDGILMHSKTITSIAALRKGWIGFGYYAQNISNYGSPSIIDIREFRAGSITN